MKKFRTILYVVSVVTGFFAAYLSFQTEERYYTSRLESRFENRDLGAGVSIQSGIVGGAAGFAVLSGLALVVASITYLKKE